MCKKLLSCIVFNEVIKGNQKKKTADTRKTRNFQRFRPCQGVPAAGLEPARYCYQWILSPPRLPFRQAGVFPTTLLILTQFSPFGKYIF